MGKLPEFRVSLTRLKSGERAYPEGDGVSHYEGYGRRTQPGGDPDWVQGERPNPECPRCGRTATFVAQIDSVEHDTKYNPHAVDAFSKDRKWMFGDVGMIYVFFCFHCLEPHAEFECG